MKPIKLEVGLEEEATNEGQAHYVWKPGGCIFPQDVVAVVILLPPEVPGRAAVPVKFVIGDYKLSGTYHRPTINPAIHWSGHCAHIINGLLTPHPESSFQL